MFNCIVKCDFIQHPGIFNIFRDYVVFLFIFDYIYFLFCNFCFNQFLLFSCIFYFLRYHNCSEIRHCHFQETKYQTQILLYVYCIYFWIPQLPGTQSSDHNIPLQYLYTFFIKKLTFYATCHKSEKLKWLRENAACDTFSYYHLFDLITHFNYGLALSLNFICKIIEDTFPITVLTLNFIFIIVYHLFNSQHHNKRNFQFPLDQNY